MVLVRVRIALQKETQTIYTLALSEATPIVKYL